MRTLTLHSWSAERLRVGVFTDTDPTVDTVEWAAVDVSADSPADDPVSWTAGSWDGAYGSVKLGTAYALSPTFGTAESTPDADVVLTEGVTYRILCRVRNASDGPGAVVATLRVV